MPAIKKRVDLYKILGIKKTAVQADVKTAYRRKARETHPDHGGDEEQFKSISKAYAVLGDGDRRRRYDAGEDPDNISQDENDIKQQARSAVYSIFVSAIDQAIDLQHNDLFEAIRNTIKINQQNDRHQKIAMQSSIERYQGILKRIKESNKSEPFINLISGRIHECNGMIAQINTHTAMWDEALKLLEGCKYECDPVATRIPAATGIFGGEWSSSTTTAGW
jgi:curved DNA-binding protein CbpA